MAASTRDGNRVKRKETRYYPTIVYEGRELGLGACRTQESARNAILMANANIAAGKHPIDRPRKSKTVGELWSEMLDTGTKTGAWRQSTIDLYSVTYSSHILDEFGNRALSDITREDIQQWVNGLCTKTNQSGEKLSPDTVDRIYRQLRHLFKEAEDYSYIDKSPFIRIKRPSPNSHEMDCLDIEEVEATLEKMDLRRQTYFSILAFAGLRAGEALALKRKNIDFESREIHVTNS